MDSGIEKFEIKREKSKTPGIPEIREIKDSVANLLNLSKEVIGLYENKRGDLFENREESIKFIPKFKEHLGQIYDGLLNLNDEEFRKVAEEIYHGEIGWGSYINYADKETMWEYYIQESVRNVFNEFKFFDKLLTRYITKDFNVEERKVLERGMYLMKKWILYRKDPGIFEKLMLAKIWNHKKEKDFLERFKKLEEKIKKEFKNLYEKDEIKLNELIKKYEGGKPIWGEDAELIMEIISRIDNRKNDKLWELLGNFTLYGIKVNYAWENEEKKLKKPKIPPYYYHYRSPYIGKPRLVYFDPESGMCWTDKKMVPEEIKNRVEATIGFGSQSRRVYWIRNKKGELVEFKGHTLPPEEIKKRDIVEASGDPEGILSLYPAKKEAEILNQLGQIEARVYPISENAVLCRKPQKGVDYHPFLRLVNLNDNEILEKLANAVNKNKIEFLENIARKLAKQLRTLHEKGIYNGAIAKGRYYSWTHSGNIDVFGNLVDILPTQTAPGYTPFERAVADIDRFFSGDRHIRAEYEKLTLEEMAIGVMSGMSISDPNFGFYDNLKILGTEEKKAFIFSFIKEYTGSEEFANEMINKIGEAEEWKIEFSKEIIKGREKERSNE